MSLKERFAAYCFYQTEYRTLSVLDLPVQVGKQAFPPFCLRPFVTISVAQRRRPSALVRFYARSGSTEYRTPSTLELAVRVGK